MSDTEHDTVRLGDVISISVALIKHIDEMPDHSTQSVKLTKITVNPDGTKVLHVEVLGR